MNNIIKSINKWLINISELLKNILVFAIIVGLLTAIHLGIKIFKELYNK